MKFCFPWEPVTPDLRAAGFAGSQRRQIHVQPVSLSASGSRFTCSWLRWHSAGAAARVSASAGSLELHPDGVPFRMRYEFGRIETLDRADPTCIFTRTVDVYGIFQDKSPLRQAVEEEILRNIRR